MKLHLGCGPIYLDGWINIDIEPSHKPDACMSYLELDKRFDANSVDYILCVHSLEHIPFNEGVETALAQMFRVLKPGGVARIVVPDLMKVAQKYVRGEDLKDIFVGPGQYWTGNIDSPATRFTFWARAWEHTILFDRKLLLRMMEDAGFRAEQREFGISPIRELFGLDRFPAESMSIEGRKP